MRSGTRTDRIVGNDVDTAPDSRRNGPHVGATNRGADLPTRAMDTRTRAWDGPARPAVKQVRAGTTRETPRRSATALSVMQPTECRLTRQRRCAGRKARTPRSPQDAHGNVQASRVRSQTTRSATRRGRADVFARTPKRSRHGRERRPKRARRRGEAGHPTTQSAIRTHARGLRKPRARCVPPKRGSATDGPCGPRWGRRTEGRAVRLHGFERSAVPKACIAPSKTSPRVVRRSEETRGQLAAA
jgi:hypothetical protein